MTKYILVFKCKQNNIITPIDVMRHGNIMFMEQPYLIENLDESFVEDLMNEIDVQKFASIDFEGAQRYAFFLTENKADDDFIIIAKVA